MVVLCAAFVGRTHDEDQWLSRAMGSQGMPRPPKEKSNTMHTDYRSEILKELRDQQVRFAPRDKKLEQVNRAEKLIEEIDPKRTYSYEYLCFRITEFRPEATPHRTMSGEEAHHDLRLFVEDVSDAANVNVDEMPEPVHTVDQLSKLFNVSTKTINRWRQAGLVGRRFIFSGRKRVGFLQSSVDRFVKTNEVRVRRSGEFSLLSSGDRDVIIDQARNLAQAGAGRLEIARLIAGGMNRSVETVRYTLKNFDQRNPDLAVFSEYTPLSEELKHQIYQAYLENTSVEELVDKHNRTKTTIYRVINEMRAQRIMELPLDYIPNSEFERKNAEEAILTPFPDSDLESTAKKTRIPSGLPPYLASLYEVPLLTRNQEYHLFRVMNFLKYRATELRQQLDPTRASSKLMDEIERLHDEAIRTKNRIVQANLRLVVSIAKRHVNENDEFFSLVSDGNMSLIRAVEKFDYSRGNKFSTYASWAIMKNFARTIPGEFKHRDRFRTSQEEMFTSTSDQRTDQFELELAQQVRQLQIGKILSRLDEREQRIIIRRFGLDPSQEPLTLKEVGEEIGVTKERVRQIEARALTKLRAAAEEERIELPE